MRVVGLVVGPEPSKLMARVQIPDRAYHFPPSDILASRWVATETLGPKTRGSRSRRRYAVPDCPQFRTTHFSDTPSKLNRDTVAFTEAVGISAEVIR